MTELAKQTGFHEAFDQNPDAGDKTSLTGDAADTRQLPIEGQR